MRAAAPPAAKKTISKGGKPQECRRRAAEFSSLRLSAGTPRRRLFLFRAQSDRTRISEALVVIFDFIFGSADGVRYSSEQSLPAEIRVRLRLHAFEGFDVADPGRRVVFGVIERELNRECVRINPLIAFFDSGVEALRPSLFLIEPRALVEANGIDD